MISLIATILHLSSTHRLKFYLFYNLNQGKYKLIDTIKREKKRKWNLRETSSNNRTHLAMLPNFSIKKDLNEFARHQSAAICYIACLWERTNKSLIKQNWQWERVVFTLMHLYWIIGWNLFHGVRREMYTLLKLCKKNCHFKTNSKCSTSEGFIAVTNL